MSTSMREALKEAIEFADQDAMALTAAGKAMIQRWRAALSSPALGEDERESVIQNLINESIDPLKLLGKHLADWLDEDHWNNAEKLLLDIAARLSRQPEAEPVARSVTAEFEQMHKDGVPICMREGETTWRTCFAGFDLSMFAQRIADAIMRETR